MTDLAMCRRAYADEIDALCKVKTRTLVDALASVPREQFLPPGPWSVRGDKDLAGARQTPDADPRHVCHNHSIAIDAGRQLFNGAPGVVVPLIDALALNAGGRVLHIGAGLGYYSALIGHVLGSAGRVVAIEVDGALARHARANLASMPFVGQRLHDDHHEIRRRIFCRSSAVDDDGLLRTWPARRDDQCTARSGVHAIAGSGLHAAASRSTRRQA